VKIAVGSDYVGWPAELSAKEFACLLEVGMSPMDAIKSGNSFVHFIIVKIFEEHLLQLSC
jgi:hypothetical protein